MVHRITTKELVESPGEILCRVRDQGERFLIEENGRTVASLNPAHEEKGAALHQLLRGIFEDGLLPDEGFAADVQALQASQPRVEPPWWGR